MERDGAHCVWCRRPLAPGHRDASLEHLVPRLKGGPAWPENELCACRPCNRRRGHTAPDVFLADGEASGLDPDRAAVERSLLRLQAAIEERGGQRRGPPHPPPPPRPPRPPGRRG